MPICVVLNLIEFHRIVCVCVFVLVYGTFLYICVCVFGCVYRIYRIHYVGRVNIR